MADFEIQRSLGRIEGKLDGIVKTQEISLMRLGRVESRVALLEVKAKIANARVAGWMAGAGTIGGAVVAGVRWLVAG